VNMETQVIPRETHLEQTPLLLEFISQQWFQLDERSRPPRVWIRQHQPLEQDVDWKPDTSIERAWLLDSTGFKEHNINVFSRFAAAHMSHPWWQGVDRPPISSLFQFGKPYEFGLALFAPYKYLSAFYVEVIWAGLYGRGYRVECHDGEVIIRNELWKS
jgi:hypothetical protein